MALPTIELCTVHPCINEAEGSCHECGRLLCYVHSFPLDKERYCYECFTRIVKSRNDSRALRDW